MDSQDDGKEVPNDWGTKSLVIYEQSRHFRVVLAEGAVGGISPRGRVSFAFYNERVPIPQYTELQIDRDGLSAEVPLDETPGLLREVEVQITMGLEEAEDFASWLTTRVERVRRTVDQGGEDV
jgi:hypothetical protein